MDQSVALYMTEYLIFEVREKEDEKNFSLVDVVDAGTPGDAVKSVQDEEVRFDVRRYFAIPESYVHEFKFHSENGLREMKSDFEDLV